MSDNKPIAMPDGRELTALDRQIIYGATGDEKATKSVGRLSQTRDVARVAYGLSALVSLIGGGFSFLDMQAANSAPQQAAAAAMGCLVIIAPYVFARSVDGMLRRD